MTTKKEKVTVNGVTLATRVSGSADKPWIVLSNSLGTTADMWAPQMPLLTSGRRVLSYDTRGHGCSGAPEGPYSFDDLVGDLVGLLDHFQIAKADVMGLSLGGMTALGVGLDHPERVNRIVCADARADAPDGFRDGWEQRIAVVRQGGIKRLVEGTMERWFTPAFRESDPAVIERATDMLMVTAPEGYVGCAHALQGLDYLKRLGDMKAPVMYIVGSEDSGAPADVMRAMAEATPESRFVAIEGAAHIANLEKPREFNAAIAEWLGLKR